VKFLCRPAAFFPTVSIHLFPLDPIFVFLLGGGLIHIFSSFVFFLLCLDLVLYSLPTTTLLRLYSPQPARTNGNLARIVTFEGAERETRGPHSPVQRACLGRHVGPTCCGGQCGTNRVCSEAAPGGPPDGGIPSSQPDGAILCSHHTRGLDLRRGRQGVRGASGLGRLFVGFATCGGTADAAG